MPRGERRALLLTHGAKVRARRDGPGAAADNQSPWPSIRLLDTPRAGHDSVEGGRSADFSALETVALRASTSRNLSPATREQVERIRASRTSGLDPALELPPPRCRDDQHTPFAAACGATRTSGVAELWRARLAADESAWIWAPRGANARSP
jgi:hypothetical protein